MISSSTIKGALFGIAVGDALGVPVEFSSRERLRQNPVTSMRGFGSHNQPPGTWSDDSSLTFCLAESIVYGLTYKDLSHRFINWAAYGYWTPHGIVFDIGIATRHAISRLEQGIQPTEAGLENEYDNGNGSLMRVLPLLFHVVEKPLKERIQLIKDVSSLTHRHIRSIIACVLYIEYARLLLTGLDKIAAYRLFQKQADQYLDILNPPQQERDLFNRLLVKDIINLTDEDVQSSGYVVHSLEATMWAFLTSATYSEAVLKAINLGEDTDTIGAITGGLAGLYYGYESIPIEWIDTLARKNDIADLADRFIQSL